jgi:hypothetical protein
MLFQELLAKGDETIVAPWLGGRALRLGARSWSIVGGLPPEHGWHAFRVAARKATWTGDAEAPPGALAELRRGYLVGDRLVDDDARASHDALSIVRAATRVHLVPAGLDRFARIVAGRASVCGPLVFDAQDFPLGPEEDVLRAYLDRAPSLAVIRGVPPALDAAFRFEVWQRDEAARHRAEIARLRQLAAEQAAIEARRRELVDRLGDGAARRMIAVDDFETAARAALAIGGATYLDHRRANRRGEIVVTFRLIGRRFECTCDETTLRIVDSGICLVDHGTGETGDRYFTLESLPGVIQQADREGRLVVFRHVDD